MSAAPSTPQTTLACSTPATDTCLIDPRPQSLGNSPPRLRRSGVTHSEAESRSPPRLRVDLVRMWLGDFSRSASEELLRLFHEALHHHAATCGGTIELSRGLLRT
jgi:hypothetical protein